MTRHSIGCVVVLGVIVGCARPTASPPRGDSSLISVGGLYAVKQQDGVWRVLKVLVVDEHTVHVRSYANMFRQQPTDLDAASLTMGGFGDPAGMGVDHIPIDRQGFLKDQPVLLKVVPVTESELLGYRYYTGEVGGDDSP